MPSENREGQGTPRIVGYVGDGRPLIVSFQGAILLSDAELDVVNHGPDFFACHVDLESKYVEVNGIGSAPDRASVTLFKTDRTLYAGSGDDPTELSIVGCGHDWIVSASSGRYTVTIVGVRRRPGR